MKAKEEFIRQLRFTIAQIDDAVASGRAEGFRICSSSDPSDPNAEFWGIDNSGRQMFGTSKNMHMMVAFPSERLARRCLSMTGGHVVSVAHVLAAQRQQLENRLRILTMKDSK